MRAKEILAHVPKEPFLPFRLRISDQASYEIPHPEMIFVADREVIVALRSTEDGIPDELVFVDPIHITRIEPLGTKRAKRKMTEGGTP